MPLSRRRRRAFSVGFLLRAALAVLVVVVLLAALGAVAAVRLIDPNGYKPQIEAAVQRATGRMLALRGPLHLGFGVPPRVTAEDVALANPSGSSRPEMATVERVEAHVALWPLFSGQVVLTDVTLVRPDIRLERDASGRANWLFAPERPASAATPAPSDPVGQPASAPASGAHIAVRAIHLVDARVGWVPPPGMPEAMVAIPRLDAGASGPDGALRLTGTLVRGSRSFSLGGEVGSLGRVFDRAATMPWPVSIMLQDAGARFGVKGTIAEPLRGRGLMLQIDASVSDFAGLPSFLPPDIPMPHDATASVQLAGGNDDGRARVAGVTLHVGAIKLASLLPGIDITRADVTAAGPDQPVRAEIEGHGAAGPLRLVVTAATLGALLPGAPAAGPLPIEITLDAGEARLSAKGTVSDPAALHGLELDVSAKLPDLAAAGEWVDLRLPRFTQVAFDGHVSGDATPTGSIAIHRATLTSPPAQIGGDLDVGRGPKPDVRGTVASPRIDLDALLAILSAPWGAGAQANMPATGGAQVQAAAPAAAARPWLIPDTPIEFGVLDRIETDVQTHVDTLQLGGVTYANVAGAVQLHDGKLVVGPLAGTMPGGSAEFWLTVDTRAPGVPVSLVLRAPSLPLAPIAAALGAPGEVRGNVSMQADLRAAGVTPHAIAGSLDGYLSLASEDGDLDNRLLQALLRRARLPEVPITGAGTTRLRCLAARLDASNGVVAVGALVADLQRLVVLGGGSLDLGREQFALHLRPMLRVGGAVGGIVVPVRVDGGFRAPKVTSDPGGKSGPPITGNGAADPCVPALAVAGGATPAPAVAEAPAKPAKGRAPSAIDVLRGLIKPPP